MQFIPSQIIFFVRGRVTRRNFRLLAKFLGFLTAMVLGFAHTVGEFGVVLMIGGNIPGETKVLSVAIYDHVETLEYPQAHLLSAGMVGFAFLVLLSLYLVNGRISRSEHV